jgi:Spy/CpxP family protein refolding chaperone
MKKVFLAMTVSILALTPILSDAQARRQQGGAPPGQGRGGRPEQRLGEAMAEVLQLTDQQRPRFIEVSGKFLERERALNEEERTARLSMRNLLCSGDTTRGPDLSKALDQMMDVQKRRHQLMEEQQKELSSFLTPYQRARFMGGREMIMGAIGGRGGRGGRVGPPPDGQGRPSGPPPGGRPNPGERGPPPDICAAPPGGQGGQGGRGGQGRRGAN